MNNILNFKFVNSIFCNDNDDILMKMEKDNMHPNKICTDSIVLRQHKMGKKKTSRKNQQNSQNVPPSFPQALSGTSGTCACSLGQVHLRCLPSCILLAPQEFCFWLGKKSPTDRSAKEFCVVAPFKSVGRRQSTWQANPHTYSNVHFACHTNTCSACMIHVPT